MEFNSEWLTREQEDAFGMDQLITFLRYNSWLLKLYKHTKWIWFGKMICRLEYLQFMKVKELSKKDDFSYQSTLSSYISEIEKDILPELKLPTVTHIDEFGDIGGYNTFNACAFPCFGVNYIAVHSGVFFHSHTLVRTLQPILMHKTNQNPLPSYLQRFFIRNFRKVAVGFLTNDRTRSFMPIRFIPEDDFLLYGIEFFIAAHEYAHILFRSNKYSDFKFNQYYTTEQLKLINSNEEIAADAVALIILKKSFDKIGSLNILYAPCFIFQLFACFDSLMDNTEKTDNAQMTHPSHLKRHNYIINMLNTLYPHSLYDQYDEIIKSTCNTERAKIKNKVISILIERKKLLKIYKEMHYRIQEITR